jgi:hypothetical protein
MNTLLLTYLYFIRLLVHVDLEILLSQGLSREKAHMASMVAGACGDKCRQALADDMIPLLCQKMQELMPAKMESVLREQGVKCHCEVKSEDDEAHYFFDMVDLLTRSKNGLIAVETILKSKGF